MLFTLTFLWLRSPTLRMLLHVPMSMAPLMQLLCRSIMFYVAAIPLHVPLPCQQVVMHMSSDMTGHAADPMGMLYMTADLQAVWPIRVLALRQFCKDALAELQCGCRCALYKHSCRIEWRNTLRGQCAINLGLYVQWAM